MNIRQLDGIISWLLNKYKQAPYRWNEQQVHSFCDSVGLSWAVPIVTIQSTPKQRSQNYQQDTGRQNKQISLLDICTRQYEDILETCNAQALYKLISNSVDINLYYQIQKLKIWSLIVLKYQHYRESLKKHYGSKLFSTQKCKSCTAEISCSCAILANLIYEIEIYIRSIYEAVGHLEQKRRHSMFISSDILNLLFKSISHLPQCDVQPLFWDMDDINVLLHVIKFEDFYSLLFQNQIDGFVLLILVNPPFKAESLFLKCLLINSEQNTANHSSLFVKRQSMVRNTMQAASKYHQINQFVHLLHYLLQVLSLTAYKNQELYMDYKNMGQRRISEIKWISLYYFDKAADLGGTKREFRKPSKSFGTVDSQMVRSRNKTTDVGQFELQVDQSVDQIKKQLSHPNVVHSATTSPYVQRGDNWITFRNYNVHQFTVCDDEVGELRGSISLQAIQPSDDLRARQNTDTQLEEEMHSAGNASQSQEEQSQHLSQPLSQQEEEPQETVEQMQQSVMQQSILMQQSVAMQQSILMKQSVAMQQSVQMQQSVLMQQSVYMPQQQPSMGESTIMQGSEMLTDSIQMQQILSSIENQRSLQQRAIKEQMLSKLEKLSAQPIFDPFQLAQQTHLKLRCDEQQKLKIVNLCGAYFGRSEECTFAFTDHSKISSKHCRIYYKDRAFYLTDVGSKGGTFVKINHNFVIEKDMSVYIGNRFAFKIIDINTETGFLEVRYEHEGVAKHKQIQLKKGDKFMIGRERSKNNFTFMHSQCNKLMSGRHMEIYYEHNFKSGSVKLMINDLESKNGTWLRLSEKQANSIPFHMQKGTKFNLSFELMYEVVDLVCDV